MGDKLRLSVGILGNGASLLLYTAPVLTFSRVFKKKSTEEFSCFPYIMTLFNCLIYTWYGLPIVSHLWENFPLVTINGVGIFLETIFIIIYFCYASPKEKVGVIFVPVIVVFGLTTAISAVVFDDHHLRKTFVGSVGLVASISMYGSPLVVLKKVAETKSVEYMPFYLSFFSFLASSLWLAYGLLSHDLFLALLVWYTSWVRRYKIKKAPYSMEDASYLTRRSLRISHDAWTNLDEYKKEDLVQKRLWEKQNLDNYFAEMRKESKRRR